MNRIDLSWFYRLGKAISALNQIRTDSPMGFVRGAIGAARPWLNNVRIDQTVSPALRATKAPADDLALTLDTIAQRQETDDAELGIDNWLNLLNEVSRFENVLSSELAIADSYLVEEKRPYSTLTLITDGQDLFPPDLGGKVPEAVRDMKEAGKCLAFEVFTAAAFHVHRATEAVLRRYWEHVTGNAPKPKVRSLGVYLAALRQNKCGNPKVIAALTQMNELHRNPTIHPDEYLDKRETIALVGIANSVVSVMLAEIPPPKTSVLGGISGLLGGLGRPHG